MKRHVILMCIWCAIHMGKGMSHKMKAFTTCLISLSRSKDGNGNDLGPQGEMNSNINVVIIRLAPTCTYYT